MDYYPELLKKIIENFKKMPGIGPKSAQRLAFYVIGLKKDEAEELSSLIKNANESVKRCLVCNNFAAGELCPICTNGKRDKSILCIVADTKDLIAVEKMGEYRGLYHVLGGLISPVDGVGPDNLDIKKMLARLQSGEIKEIILAFSPTVEGEATMLYLTKLLKPLGVKVTRIAYGLPMGADMDYADEVTILKALEGRREM